MPIPNDDDDGDEKVAADCDAVTAGSRNAGDGFDAVVTVAVVVVVVVVAVKLFFDNPVPVGTKASPIIVDCSVKTTRTVANMVTPLEGPLVNILPQIFF